VTSKQVVNKRMMNYNSVQKSTHNVSLGKYDSNKIVIKPKVNNITPQYNSNINLPKINKFDQNSLNAKY